MDELIKRAHNEYAKFYNEFLTEFENAELDEKTEPYVLDIMKDMMELKISMDRIMVKDYD